MRNLFQSLTLQDPVDDSYLPTDESKDKQSSQECGCSAPTLKAGDEDPSVPAFSYEELTPKAITTKNVEKEYNTKCTYEDPEVIKTLGSYIDIEQWTIFIDKLSKGVPIKGSSRVRKESSIKGVKYTLTDKLLFDQEYNEAYSERAEYNAEITEQHFNTRKLLSDSGQIKRRYEKVCDVEGPFKGYTWTIDIFYNTDGTLSKVAHIEIEVNEEIKEPMPIPSGFTIMNEMQKEVSKSIVVVTT